jgi:UDP-glucose 6-dehydrogenase
MNDFQKSRFANIMVSRMFNTITGKRIAMLGFAFKKDTGASGRARSVAGLMLNLTCLRLLNRGCAGERCSVRCKGAPR